MTCWGYYLLAVLLLAAPVSAEPGTGPVPDKAVVFSGKVVPASDLRKDGLKADTGVSLVADDGKIYPLVKDDVSLLLFLDKQLHNRTVRLTGVVMPGSNQLRVERVQTVKDGKVYDVDYWCDNCQLRATQPGPCMCCGGPTVLREQPAK